MKQCVSDYYPLLPLQNPLSSYRSLLCMASYIDCTNGLCCLPASTCVGSMESMQNTRGQDKSKLRVFVSLASYILGGSMLVLSFY